MSWEVHDFTVKIVPTLVDSFVVLNYLEIDLAVPQAFLLELPGERSTNCRLRRVVRGELLGEKGLITFPKGDPNSYRQSLVMPRELLIESVQVHGRSGLSQSLENRIRFFCYKVGAENFNVGVHLSYFLFYVLRLSSL